MSAETRIRRVSKEELGKVIDELGENVSQVLAAKSNSDNKEYTITYSYTLPTMTATEPGESDDLLGASLTDLQTDVTIADGNISGTIKYMEDYDGFSTDAEGHFFAVKATTTSGEVHIIGTTPNGSKEFKIYDSEDSTNYDGVFIMKIENDNLEKLDFRYIDGDEETLKQYKVNFTYEPKEDETAEAETPAAEGGSDNSEGGTE